MHDNDDIKIPDDIKKLFRKEYLQQIGSTSTLDHYEMDLFNWYYLESEKQLRKMISAENDYIEQQANAGEENINDTGMVAVDYYLKRSRYSNIIYLVSLFESFLDNSCIKLCQLIGENNQLFNVSELKGDQWSVKKKYLERYGNFLIPTNLWSEIQVLIKLRNNIVHDNGRVSALKREERRMFEKHEEISLDSSEVLIHQKYIKTSIEHTKQCVDFIESKLRIIAERAIKPQPAL